MRELYIGNKVYNFDDGAPSKMIAVDMDAVPTIPMASVLSSTVSTVNVVVDHHGGGSQLIIIDDAVEESAVYEVRLVKANLSDLCESRTIPECCGRSLPPSLPTRRRRTASREQSGTN